MDLAPSHPSELLERWFLLSPEPACILDREARFAAVSHAFEGLGYASVKVLGRPLLDFLHEEDVPAARDALKCPDALSEPRELHVRLRLPDESFHPVSLWMVGSPGGALLVARHRPDGQDSEHQDSEHEVSKLNRFLDAIIDGIPHMVFVKDAARLSFVRMNRAGEELLGVSRDELVGKTDFELFPAAEAEFFQQKDRETLSGKVLVEIQEEPIATSSGQRWLHTQKVPLVDEAGVPQFLLGISQDITELKRTRAALAESRDETLALNRELEAFSYSVAHDLRAPLRSMDGFSQAVLEDYEDKLDEEGRKYLRYIRESAQDMAQLIDDMLTLSRVSRAELAKQPVNLSHLAGQTVARLRQLEPDRQVDVSIDDGLIADADPRLLAVVFDNLLGNAWKFTQKCARAQISVGRATLDHESAFFVRDDGAGFDMRYAHKLFGAFQRLHAAQDFEGTGVGLATVQRIVHKHGGRIWAHAQPEQGATFFFTLTKGDPEHE